MCGSVRNGSAHPNEYLRFHAPKRTCTRSGQRTGIASICAMSVQHHPSAMRNRVPISKALTEIVDKIVNPNKPKLSALEIASGTGCHVEYFATTMPNVIFQPSEYVPPSALGGASVGKIGSSGLEALETIDAVGSCFDNVLKAVPIDVTRPLETWPASVQKKFELVYVSNLLHISPWYNKPPKVPPPRHIDTICLPCFCYCFVAVMFGLVVSCPALISVPD